MANTIFKPGAAAGLVNPMTSGGDLIYGDAVGNATRLPNGSAGQVLQSAGGANPPAWANAPGLFNWHGYYPGSSANFWSVASSAGFTHLPPTGTIPAPTELTNSNFGAVVKGISNFPGIMFTAPRTGTLKIDFILSLIGSNAASSATWATFLTETVGASSVAFGSGTWWGTGATLLGVPVPMMGMLNTTAGSTYNLEIKGVSSAGTMFIGGAANAGSELDVVLHYIT